MRELIPSFLCVFVIIGCGGGDEANTTPSSSSVNETGTTEPGGSSVGRNGPAGGDGGGVVDASSDSPVDSSTAQSDWLRFNTFTVNDQGAIPTTGTINGVASTGYRIVQSSGGWICGGASYANAEAVELELTTTAASLTPGKYAVTGGGTTTSIRAAFRLLDAACNEPTSHPAQSGSITITKVSATTVEGMYDVEFSGFAGGGRTVGGFIAPICNTAAWSPNKRCNP